ELAHHHFGSLSSGRHLCGKGSQRRTAGGLAGAASRQVRIRDQSGNRESARPCRANTRSRRRRRGDRVRRREFITLLGGAAAWPLAARAQQPAQPATIGCLVPGTPSSHGQWFAVFVQRLRELGWIEGRTVAVEYRWAEGRSERFAEIAAEFVQRKVDVIVTASTGGVLAAKQATSII